MPLPDGADVSRDTAAEVKAIRALCISVFYSTLPGEVSVVRASEASTNSPASLSASLTRRAGPPADGDLRGGDLEGDFSVPERHSPPEPASVVAVFAGHCA